MIVVDASVLVGVVAEDHEGARSMRRRLADERLLAPELIDIEVASAVRRARRSGALDDRRAMEALGDLALLPLTRVSHVPLLGRVWDLRENLSAYDAAYVALAELFNIPLQTRDVRLARAPGLRCEVVVVS